MARKEGQFVVVELKFFSINLNAQHVNGMTHFGLTVHGKTCTFMYFN